VTQFVEVVKLIEESSSHWVNRESRNVRVEYAAGDTIAKIVALCIFSSTENNANAMKLANCDKKPLISPSQMHPEFQLRVAINKILDCHVVSFQDSAFSFAQKNFP
jgi:hypothetical protein